MANTEKPLGHLLLNNVRLAFPALFEPTSIASTDGKPSKPRYSAMLIIGPDHPQLQEIKDAQSAVAKDKWRDKAPTIMKGLEKQDKIALHDGDTKAKYDGFEGSFFISAASPGDKPAPKVVDRDRSPLSAKSGRPYSGCFVNVIVDLWAQDNQYGQRINATLGAVQFFADGDSFGAGRQADTDEFESFEEVNDFA